MAVSKQFTPVNFSQGQLLDTDTLNQLNANDTFVRDQMVDGRYQGDWGFTVDTGLKLFGGRIRVGGINGRVVVGTVAFPALFSANCQPIITTSLICPTPPVYEHAVFGIGTYFPDHRGFQFKVRIGGAYPNQVFNDLVYLQYICLGY